VAAWLEGTDVTCEIKLMGGFEVRVDSDTVADGAWRRRRAAELVKILALEKSHRLHRERIMDALWPDLPPHAAAANLRKAVHFARRTLGSEDAIITGPEMLALWPGEDVLVDASRFERAASAALAANDRAAAAHAAALYGGELLPEDRYAPWSNEPRERLRVLAIQLLKAASHWESVLDIDPADEESHRALMEQALKAGDRTGAIRQFERLRQRLRIDLGMGPDEASVALYERALVTHEPEEPPSAVERIWALLAWGLVHMRADALDRAEQQAEQARKLAFNANLTTEVGEASALLGIVANTRGRWKDVFRAEFIDAVQHSREITAQVFDAHLCIAEFCLFGLSGSEEMARYAKELLEISRGKGSIHGRALAELLLGEAALIADRLDSACEHLTAAKDLHRQAGAVGGQVIAIQRLADHATAKGDHGRAGRLLWAGLQLAGSSAMAPHLMVRMHEGLVAAADGPAELKAAETGESALIGQVVCPPCSIGFRLAATKAFARNGRIDLAHERLEEAEQLARMWPGGPWHAASWEARGELRRAQSDEEAAVVMFREAAARFSAADRPRDAARCLAAQDGR
jgi:DNA-binding SARP family transcriptional activator